MHKKGLERMEQAAPPTSRASRQWLLHFDVVLTLCCVAGVAVLGWPVLSWAAQGAIQAPLAMLAATAMLLLPGLALLRLLWPAALAPDERWPLAIGLSCALLPLLLLGSLPLGLRWNGPLCWGFLALCALVLLWPRRGEPLRARIAGLRGWLDRPNLLLLALTLAALAARLYPARVLPVGMFGDSYHHTIITQLLVDHGGLFSSWQPYAALRTFTYHYGFHSTAAWLSWLSGMPTTSSVLVVGQSQSALVVPLTYLFTRRVLGDQRAALWAALLVGFVSVMPAYYVNWGRYTQLAGQLVLPVVCVCWMELLGDLRFTIYDLRKERSTTADTTSSSFVIRHSLFVILTSLATAGLVLTHYRVAVFAACFVLAYALYLLVSQVRSARAFGVLAVRGLLASALTLLLVAPWLLRLREGALLRIGQYYMAQNVGAEDVNSLPTWQEFFSLYGAHYLVPLAALGLVLLLAGRQWRALVLVGWAGLVWLAANPYLVGLNGAGIISNFAVLIAVYLVLAPLAGAGVALDVAWLGRALSAPRAAVYAQLVGGTLIVAWGLHWQQGILDSRFQLFTQADSAAMEWIKRETPPDARFFVNSFAAYSNTVYAGSDGGWWLPFTTGRHTNLPPISQGQEAGEQPDYQLAVTAANRALEARPVGSREEAAALRAAGYSYLYDGPAASPGNEYINPAALNDSPYYKRVYSKDGATVWKIK